MAERANKKRLSSVVGFVISVVIFSLALIIFVSALIAKRENKPFEIFGYSTAIVQTDSMEPYIKVGDLIVIKSSKIEQAKLGDYAVFISRSPAIYGERVVHEVIEIGEDEGGYYIITRGKNFVDESAIPTEKIYSQDYVGTAILNNAFLGAFVGFFTRTENLIFLFIIVVIVFFAVSQIKKIIKTVKEKKNKTDGAPDENSGND